MSPRSDADEAPSAESEDARVAARGVEGTASRREVVSSALSFRVESRRRPRADERVAEEPPAPARETHTTAAQQKGAAVVARAARCSIRARAAQRRTLHMEIL